MQKEIFYINNVFEDERISNYQKKYTNKNRSFRLLIQSSIKIRTKELLKTKNIKVKFNTPKNKFLTMVNKAKEYIK